MSMQKFQACADERKGLDYSLLVTCIKDADVQKEFGKKRDKNSVLATQKFRNRELCHYECCEDQGGLILTSLMSLHRCIFIANSTTDSCL